MQVQQMPGLAYGKEKDQVPYQPNRVLARQLGLNIVDLPDGHLGFMSSPTEFVKELMNALKDDLI